MNSKNILIADDEPRIRKLVGDFLKKEGYFVIEVGDGSQAIEKFSEHQSIDLVILDVMMPQYDGWMVCREIRKTSRVPIIMLTARSQETDELLGFELGADEYITKPFSVNILVARINALFRRLEGEKNTTHNFGLLEIDSEGRYVYIDGESINLSPKEYELLIYMTENKGKAMSREQILNSVWGYDYFGELRTVDTHIKRLRDKLGEKCQFIQTVRGLGYRFEVKKCENPS